MASARIGTNTSRTVLLAVAIAFVAGCQRSEKVTVSGRIVRQDGTPLKAATVIARSDATGKWAMGTTDADGHYELGTANAGDGISPGEYHVVIMEDLGDSGQRPATIPAKYGNQSTSKLQLTVGEGRKVVFDITLDRT